MALQNVDGVLTGRGLMDCLQYYDNCLFNIGFISGFSNKATYNIGFISGLSEKDINMIFQIFSAVLHFGNVKINEKDGESSEMAVSIELRISGSKMHIFIFKIS
jgi:hypothetical protein